MSNVTPFTDYQRDLSRYDRDTAGARIGANKLSLIPVVSSVESLSNRIEADAARASLSDWERRDLERTASTLEEAAARLRRASGFTQQLQAAE